MDTAYTGIDYSLGKSNFDKNTGIHFGVISSRSIMPEAYADIEPIYPECEKCDEQDQCEYFKDGEYCDAEPIGLEYEDKEYHIIDCLDSDLMVLKSPYYTFSQFCSPCVPGAGNLDSPCPTGVKTYCLGDDWFENGVAPYLVFKVAEQEIKNG
jgi:hypothetical protein